MTDARRDLVLWTTDLGPPIVWLFSFQANFTLAPWACVFQVKAWLYFVFVLALILELGLAWLAVPRVWRHWWWALAPGLGVALQSAVLPPPEVGEERQLEAISAEIGSQLAAQALPHRQADPGVPTVKSR